MGSLRGRQKEGGEGKVGMSKYWLKVLVLDTKNTDTIPLILTTGIERRFDKICDLSLWIFYISGGLISKPQPIPAQESAYQENPTEVRPRTSSLRLSLPACQQSNGNSEARMSEKCEEWRD